MALIACLILGGITLIGIGFLTDAGEQETGTEQAPEAQQPERNQDPDQGQQAPAPAEPAPAEPAPAGSAPAPAAGIDRRSFENRFELGVPTGWDSGSRDGGTLLTAPGRKAEVLVLFGSQQPAERLGPVAAEVLRNQYPGAQVGRARPTRVGGQPALRVNGEHRGGEVSAVALNGGGATYVITKRVVRGAPAQVAGQAEAIIQSFRPL